MTEWEKSIQAVQVTRISKILDPTDELTAISAWPVKVKTMPWKAIQIHTVYNSSGLNVYNVCATWDALPSINTHVFFPAHWVSSSAFASHSHWADGVRDGCRSRQEGQAGDNRRYLKDLALQNQMFQK